ncbi:hypothetical protein FOCC_FOCC001957 [Frankliniella occidentalis]|nr:hypothetical protein FOCC_FOCC001957 [Frankliniella occidentalis]
MGKILVLAFVFTTAVHFSTSHESQERIHGLTEIQKRSANPNLSGNKYDSTLASSDGATNQVTPDLRRLRRDSIVIRPLGVTRIRNEKRQQKQAKSQKNKGKQRQTAQAVKGNLRFSGLL